MLMLLESAAVATYLWCTWRLRSQSGPDREAGLVLATALAVLMQALALGMQLNAGPHWHLGVGQAFSLFLWMCCVVHLLLGLRWPLWHLGIWLWPAAALAIVLAWLMPPGAATSSTLSTALRAHILLSLLAYASLTLAALQTLAYALLDKQLKQGRHQHQRPPLQVMEDLVFRLVGIGFVLLCASIASGFLFVDDFFSQHLAHKAALSLIACALFGALITGRMLRGWRGRIAIRWTLSAYISLLLAYFGSKLVLEQILGRSWS